MINLRAERINRGLSLRIAAEQMGLADWKTLQRAETGEAVPQIANAYKIASFFGVQVTDVWPLDREAA